MDHPIGVTLRGQLEASGWNSAQIHRALHSGQIGRVRPSVYERVSDDGSSTALQYRWLSRLRAFQELLGPNAVVSHRSACRMHGFDDVGPRAFRTKGVPSSKDRTEWPIDFRAPGDLGRRTDPHVSIFRSKPLQPEDIVEIDGLRVTTPVRTLIDVARLATHIDTVEQLIESALRGDDPAKPFIWNQELLSALKKRAGGEKGRGPSLVRRIVHNRPDDFRPTGSYPETVLLQAIRKMGMQPTPQPDVEIVQGERLLTTYFPDLAIFQRGLLVEVDGFEGHSTRAQLERDAERQNRLAIAFTVIRFSATQVLRNPLGCAEDVRRRHDALPARPDSWKSPLCRLETTTAGMRIVT
jgi:very-short-patch-repair endonuclease